MDHNPYAPPRVPSLDLPPAAAGEPMFFPVSLLKLAALSLCTLGLYEIYWCYRNWVLIKRRERSPIVPALRAFFGVIFCWALFTRIQRTGESQGVTQAPPARLLAVGWIGVTLCWKLPDPYWLVSLLAPVLMLPMQDYANRINAQVTPGHAANARFGWVNIVAVVVGGLLLVLAAVGTIVSPER